MLPKSKGKSENTSYYIFKIIIGKFGLDFQWDGKAKGNTFGRLRSEGYRFG